MADTTHRLYLGVITMPRGRPKGSKSKDTSKYKLRTRMVRKKYGKDAYKKWGKKGGNPVLLKQRR